jgi:hypothetical protein
MQSFKLFYKCFKKNESPENRSNKKLHYMTNVNFFLQLINENYIVYRLQPGMLFSML